MESFQSALEVLMVKKYLVHGKDEIFYGPAKHWFEIKMLRPRNEPLRHSLRKAASLLQITIPFLIISLCLQQGLP